MEKIYRVKLNSKGMPNFSTAVEVDTDISEYSDKLWRSAYERGKADGAMIYGNEHNCIMTIFGECSYAETGCGDCAIVEKVRKALSADRPQEWIPCSERLPKWKEHTDDMVLVCYADGSVRFNTFMNWQWVQGEPIAWMPLPKPWKGADDD